MAASEGVPQGRWCCLRRPCDDVCMTPCSHTAVELCE
jgi:hypothetical protein